MPLPITPISEKKAPVRHRWFRPLAVLCLVLLASGSARGQGGRGNQGLASIHGTLTTAQDNALAGITVKLSPGEADAVPVTADTDESGRYEFKNVKPGAYTVSVVGLTGFKPFAKAVQVEAGQSLELAIRVEIEAVAEKVE